MAGKGLPAPEPASEQPGPLEQQALDCIRGALRGLRFGQVTVVVQDGVVVQVERIERTRPARASSRRC